MADDVKALDQEARAGQLRKHGIRFGQFTIFMPALLKPAPTRLRLVLWSLSKGLGEFPESPPPGLVTVGHPRSRTRPRDITTMAGYRAAGERAIRIDMLERLADMLRAEDSRGGFEAKADMLSITGMTLEQFANLMEGLGYRAERGERQKEKPAPVPEPVPQEPAPEAAAEAASETTETASEDAAPETPPEAPEAEAAASDPAPEAAAAPVPEEPQPDAPAAEPVAETPLPAEPASEPAAEPASDRRRR